MQNTASVVPFNTQTIVEASAKHMSMVCDIYAHYVRTSICTMEETPPTVAEMHRRHDALRREGLPWLVALDGDEVLGYAYAGRYRPRPGYSRTAETSIYIHPEHRGRRIGQALMDSLVQKCTVLEMRQMVAVIVTGDDTAGSIRLHERSGFKRAGVFERVGRKFGGDVDTLLMQLSLVAP